jgi:hypothetical protein
MEWMTAWSRDERYVLILTDLPDAGTDQLPRSQAQRPLRSCNTCCNSFRNTELASRFPSDRLLYRLLGVIGGFKLCFHLSNRPTVLGTGCFPCSPSMAGLAGRL